MNENTTELLPGLYGSMIDRSRMVGICKYHKTAMTVKTIKQHGCLCKHGRQCDAFQKCEEHDFWRQHEQKKERRKAKKQMVTSIIA
jgi:hypothetical protein